MTIEHLSVTHISRGKGGSAVASAAYRAAEMIEDERVGTTHDFRKKQGVEATFIMAPAGLEWVKDRSALWNAVEFREKRGDARLATEVRIALPHELTNEQRQELTREFAQALVDRYKVAIEVAIHAPPARGDERNWHAHLMMTTREVTTKGFTAKTELQLANKDLIHLGRPTSREQIVTIRQLWEHTANVALTRAGREERIDMRSYIARGIDIKPTVHMGAEATAMMRSGRGSAMERQNQQACSRSAEILRINPEKAILVVEREKSVFDRKDVARIIHRFVSDPVLFSSILERAMAHESIVQLAPEFRDLATGKVLQEARFATQEMVRIEHQMVRSAVTLAERGGFARGQGTVAKVLARFEAERGFALNAEQQEAVRHVTDDRALAAVVGLAGTGKSTMLEAARQVLEAEGHRVLGAALAGKAAAELTKSSGIEARTLASWEARWEKGREEHKLRAGDVFVIDEAGMVSSRQLARIVAKVEEAGAKLVLVGDPQQLQPIQAGAAFRAIVEKTGFLELTDIRRQKEGWQRQTSLDLARGEVGKAISAYLARGLVEASSTAGEVYHKVVTEWFDERDPAKTAVVLAYRNKDVDALNEAIRNERITRGEIDAGHEFSSIQRRTKPLVSIELMENSIEESRAIRLSAGDRVLLGKGWGELKNGLLGSVLTARPGEIEVKLDGGQAVTINAESYAYVSHGYAMTIHKAQGLTADRSYVVASPVDDRHLAYVAMSRHREQAKLHWATEDFKNKTLVEGLSRSRAKEATTDYQVDIDAFLERRGLESRRTMAEAYAAYKDQAAAWISAKRERLEATWQRVEAAWQRFEVLIGQRQEQNVDGTPKPLVAASAAASGVDHTVAVPGLSRQASAALDQVYQTPDRLASRAAISAALADPVIAKEISEVGAAVEKRYGPWNLGLGLHVGGSREALEQRYGREETAALMLHAETLRAVNLVRETAHEQRNEVLARQRLRAEPARTRPLAAAVSEFPQTVEQAARHQTILQGSPYHQEIRELYRLAAPGVQRLADLMRAIDNHIRAHAGEADAQASVRQFVLENAGRIGGLRGSTKLLDFAGREGRRQALQSLEALAEHAPFAAKTYAHELQHNREVEEDRRRRMAVEIPALSTNALSSLANIERSQANVALTREIRENPAFKAELEAHTQAMATRFGPHYATEGLAAIEARLPAEDIPRAAEIFQATRILEEAKHNDIWQRQQERAQQQGLQQGITRSM